MASTRQIIHIIYSKSHTEQNINILSRFFIFKTYNTSKWFNSMPAEFYECFNTKNFLNWKTALEYPWIRKSIDWTSRATGKVQRWEQLSTHYDAAPGKEELPNLRTEMQEEPPLVTFNLKIFFQWWPKSCFIISVMTKVMTGKKIQTNFGRYPSSCFWGIRSS